jgi:hypothetical protein
MTQRPELVRRVDEWAKVHAIDAYRYSSPASYWATAWHEGVVTVAEYDEGRRWYGESWNRSGD